MTYGNRFAVSQLIVKGSVSYFIPCFHGINRVKIRGAKLKFCCYTYINFLSYLYT